LTQSAPKHRARPAQLFQLAMHKKCHSRADDSTRADRLLAFEEFRATLGAHTADHVLASSSDLYTVYNFLHAHSRCPQLSSVVTASHTLACFKVLNSSSGTSLNLGDSLARHIVVPVNKDRSSVSLRTLSSWFSTGGDHRFAVSVAIVDSDGAVSMLRMFDDVQPPRGDEHQCMPEVVPEGITGV
jgi:hypothetical protein